VPSKIPSLRSPLSPMENSDEQAGKLEYFSSADYQDEKQGGFVRKLDSWLHIILTMDRVHVFRYHYYAYFCLSS